MSCDAQGLTFSKKAICSTLVVILKKRLWLCSVEWYFACLFLCLVFKLLEHRLNKLRLEFLQKSCNLSRNEKELKEVRHQLAVISSSTFFFKMKYEEFILLAKTSWFKISKRRSQICVWCTDRYTTCGNSFSQINIYKDVETIFSSKLYLWCVDTVMCFWKTLIYFI